MKVHFLTGNLTRQATCYINRYIPWWVTLPMYPPLPLQTRKPNSESGQHQEFTLGTGPDINWKYTTELVQIYRLKIAKPVHPELDRILSTLRLSLFSWSTFPTLSWPVSFSRYKYFCFSSSPNLVLLDYADQ